MMSLLGLMISMTIVLVRVGNNDDIRCGVLTRHLISFELLANDFLDIVLAT